MRLSLDRALPLDSAVRVDLGNSILLGEVCYSRPDNEGYVVGLMVDQVLHETVGLRPLMDAVSADTRVANASASEAHAMLSG
jgi:hypothetical protein